MAHIITGEKIQQLCAIYFGLADDFSYNPRIANDQHKHYDLANLLTPFSNPFTIFCYSHRIDLLSQKVHLLLNPFILVTHNSDGEVHDSPLVQRILTCQNLNLWYAQNLCFDHDKLTLLPIGLANSMWPHGNLQFFENPDTLNIDKSMDVYFQFNIDTNPSKRQTCFDALSGKLPWLPTINPLDNLNRLKSYRFCICPEGNGVDTHRLWEALYLQVVPIVLNTPFSTILHSYGVPLLILDHWSDLDMSSLNYSQFDFTDERFFLISTFIDDYLHNR